MPDINATDITLNGTTLGIDPGNPGKPPGYLEKYAGQMEGVGEDQKKAFGDYQSALAKPMSALSRANSAPIPAPPQQEKIPAAPQANPQEYRKDAMAFASAMAVLGAVASRFTRTSGQAALGAFAGAMKGWQEGNREAYEAKAHEWEQNTKKTIDNNKMVLEKYKEVLANRQMNIDQQMSQIQLLAAQYQDRMTFDAAAAKNYTMVAQIYEKSHEATQKAQQAFEALQEKRNVDKLRYGGVPSLSPETQRRIAEQVLAGDTTARQNIGRGIQGAADIRAINEMVTVVGRERGMDGAAVAKANAEFQGEKAYQRTAGTQGARVESAANEVEQLLPQALETSRNLPRGKFVPINTLLQKWEQGTSDPAYNDFALANFSLVNAYTRAMNPQGVPRVNDRLEQHAIGILSTATDQKAYEVQASRLWKEVQASKTAQARTAEGRTPGDINSPVPGGAPPSNDGWTVKEK